MSPRWLALDDPVADLADEDRGRGRTGRRASGAVRRVADGGVRRHRASYRDARPGAADDVVGPERHPAPTGRART